MVNNNFSPIVISGPSGAGKTELIDYLKKRDSIFEEAPGVTTRPRRVGETGNTDFITMDEFKRHIENDELIQYAKYNDNYYGTLKTALGLLHCKQVLFNMSYNGTMSLKRLRPDSSLIYVLPPTKEEIIRRMGDRDKRRYQIGVEQTLISYTKDLEHLYDDFMSIFERRASSQERSLKLEKNRDFMRRFYN